MGRVALGLTHQVNIRDGFMLGANTRSDAKQVPFKCMMVWVSALPVVLDPNSLKCMGYPLFEYMEVKHASLLKYKLLAHSPPLRDTHKCELTDERYFLF